MPGNVLGEFACTLGYIRFELDQNCDSRGQNVALCIVLKTKVNFHNFVLDMSEHIMSLYCVSDMLPRYAYTPMGIQEEKVVCTF